MFNLDKMDGSKFYTGIAAIVVVALGGALAPDNIALFLEEITLLDASSMEGQAWYAWMLWAFRSAMKKLEK